MRLLFVTVYPVQNDFHIITDPHRQHGLRCSGGHLGFGFVEFPGAEYGFSARQKVALRKHSVKVNELALSLKVPLTQRPSIIAPGDDCSRPRHPTGVLQSELAIV
jgi:hypothetical protein